MLVRLLQNCKHGNKGEQIEMRTLFAKLLIMRGRAKKVEPTYRLGDLCYGHVVHVEDREVYEYVEGSTSDIVFYVEPLFVGIFKYETPEFYKHMFASGDYYTHIVTGEDFVSTKYLDNIKIKPNHAVINHETIGNVVEDFPEEIEKRGWNKDSMLTPTEISLLEGWLILKYHDYMTGLRRVRGF